jgi:hypothetical protein
MQQTEGIPHIGKETRAKILEILTTGKLQRNDTLLADPKTRAKLQVSWTVSITYVTNSVKVIACSFYEFMAWAQRKRMTCGVQGRGR